jgi:hypothetical protein
MNRFLLLAALSGLVSCNPAAVHSDPLTAFHGQPQLDILVGPDYVESFRLDPYSFGTKERGERFAGYLTVSHGPRLNGRQQIELFPLLLDADNYGFEFSQGCEFTPGVGLRFVRSTQKVDMLICFGCNEWQFEHGGRVVGEDFHRKRVRPRLVGMAKELFPTDIVIRSLTVEGD